MSVRTRTLVLPKSRRTLTYELERKSVKRLNLRVRHDGTVHLSIPKHATLSEAEAFLRDRHDGTVHLSIPKHATLSEAEAFLRDREEWVLGALSRMEKRAKAHPQAAAVGDSLPYLGGKLEVVWRAGFPARIEANMAEGRLTVTLPDPADAEMRAAAIETFEKAESKKLVVTLVERYYPLFAARGVPYPKAIRVKVMTTRFGSCSAGKGYLNFASRLCEYPVAFIEYVVVHELCHFLEANHSDRFWREVARVLPDWEARERMGKM